VGKFLKQAGQVEKAAPAALQKLKNYFGSSLPDMQNIEFTTSWGGPTSFPSTLFNVIRLDHRHPSIIHNYGFSAFLPAVLSGSMVKGLVLGKAYEDAEAEKLRLAIVGSRIPWLGMLADGIRFHGRSIFSSGKK
jgi:glycine/D-amino acid oxidase-like deaminating enzyme